MRGFGVSEVTATGARSELGRIGQSLKDLTPEVTSMYREVRRIVRWVAIAGVLLCMVVALLYGATRHDWLGGVLAGITLAMGVLPEEFPVVLTVFLAMGAWRISRANVLTRRMPAVETIGAVTVLAVDKTGTLTENRMRLALIQTMDRTFDLRLPGVKLEVNAGMLLGTALAASEERRIRPNGARHPRGRGTARTDAHARPGGHDPGQGVRPHARTAGRDPCMAATRSGCTGGQREGRSGNGHRPVRHPGRRDASSCWNR